MIAETGHYALILALGVAIIQTVLPLWGTRRHDAQLMAVTQRPIKETDSVGRTATETRSNGVPGDPNFDCR